MRRLKISKSQRAIKVEPEKNKKKVEPGLSQAALRSPSLHTPMAAIQTNQRGQGEWGQTMRRDQGWRWRDYTFSLALSWHFIHPSSGESHRGKQDSLRKQRSLNLSKGTSMMPPEWLTFAKNCMICPTHCLPESWI